MEGRRKFEKGVNILFIEKHAKKGPLELPQDIDMVSIATRSLMF